jgi:galactokinase
VVVGQHDSGVGDRPGLDVAGVSPGVAPPDLPGGGIDGGGPPGTPGDLLDVDDQPPGGQDGDVGDAAFGLHRPPGRPGEGPRGGCVGRDPLDGFAEVPEAGDLDGGGDTGDDQNGDERDGSDPAGGHLTSMARRDWPAPDAPAWRRRTVVGRAHPARARQTPLSMSLVETVTAAFVELTGRAPEGVWRAPGRVNLIGEHTDYNDGFVLPVAIDRSIVVAAGRRDDGLLRSWSVGDRNAPASRPLAELGPGVSSGWSAYVEGVAWVLLQEGLAVPGADLVVHADLPAGAGLSSSAALESAAGLALTELAGGSVDRVALALAGQRAETEVVGMPCGLMDQMVVLSGRAGHALFFDTRTLETEQIPFDPGAAGLALLVIDTRVKHTLAGSPYGERRAACERAAAALGVAALRDAAPADVEKAAADGRLDDVTFRRARHVVTENARVLEVADLLRSGDVGAIGPALAGSHRSLRDDYEVSCPELDLAVDTAVAAGAVAARMTGAGFGGSALALVPAESAEAVGLAIAEAFTAAGFGPPATFPVNIADGASRAQGGA